MSSGVDEQSQNGVPEWSRVEQLTCELSVHIPVAGFGVRDLLRLCKDEVVDARWDLMKEVPLEVSGRQVAWCEFEVVGERLAVRITELR
jgi:flagellar motor switch protein FliM